MSVRFENRHIWWLSAAWGKRLSRFPNKQWLNTKEKWNKTQINTSFGCNVTYRSGKKDGKLQYLCKKKAGIKYEIPAVNGSEAKRDSEASVVYLRDWKVWKYLFTLHPFNGVSQVCYWVESLKALMLGHLCPSACSRSQRVWTSRPQRVSTRQLTFLDMSHAEGPWNERSEGRMAAVCGCSTKHQDAWAALSCSEESGRWSEWGDVYRKLQQMYSGNDNKRLSRFMTTYSWVNTGGVKKSR